MLPLLELRNELDVADDRHLRDFRRMSGLVQIFHDRPIPGPYKQRSREQWVRRVLGAQQWIRRNGPSHVSGMELISLPELHEIRRIWVVEKHEIEDTLPGIYAEEMGEPFPGGPLDDNLPFNSQDMAVLRNVCGENELTYELTRELLDVERRFSTSARRAGLFDALESAFTRSFYTDEQDATDRALRERDAKDSAQKGDYEQLSLTSDILQPQTISEQ
jgi:DNA sulfur modification protein DndC